MDEHGTFSIVILVETYAYTLMIETSYGILESKHAPMSAEPERYISDGSE